MPALSRLRPTLVGTLTVASLVAGGLVLAGSAQAAPAPQTFTTTGDDQIYTVPDGITAVTVTLAGGSGSGSSFSGGGGAGRLVTADLVVTPGDTFHVQVGGSGSGTTGGYNGGGAGGHGGRVFNEGGAGGGASDIRSGTSLDSRLMIAAGGGGGGVNSAGNADADAPNSRFFACGGKAGTQSAGGAGGSAGNQGAPGVPGGLAVGGDGPNGVGGGTPGGGGGGGGRYGGGSGGSGGAGCGGGGGSSYVTPDATNVTYGYASGPSVTFTPIVYEAPTVTSQPVDVAVTAGQDATFTAKATGSPAPTVQWRVSTDGGDTFDDVPGGTSTTLTIANTTLAQSGNRYRAVFTNTFDGTDHTASSDAAILTVGEAPVVTTQPQDAVVTAGQDATFTAAATGSPTPTVRWEVRPAGGTDWSTVAGATGSTLTVATTAADQGNQYRAVFANTIGGVERTATSDDATLTVYSAPVITTQPVGTSVGAGATATFSAAATGYPTPTVQWQFSTDGGANWSDVAAANGTTLAVPDTTLAMNGNRYRAVFSNTFGGADHMTTTDAADLTVLAGPVVTTQPVDVTVPAGGDATFSAAASGNPSLTVQWQVSVDGAKVWTDIAGATANTLTVPAVTVAMTGNRYRAVFTNTFAGSDHTAASDSAGLTVVTAPMLGPVEVPATATVGTVFSYTFTASGSPAPMFTVASGSLPPGLVLDPGTGTVSGNPTTAGAYTFVVAAANGIGIAATTAPITVTVFAALTITTTALPDGVVGTDYSTRLEAGGGDGSPFVWSLTVGSTLPDGLSLASDGVISGTPTTAGKVSFAVRIGDPAVRLRVAAVSARLSITITAPATATPGTATDPPPGDGRTDAPQPTTSAGPATAGTTAGLAATGPLTDVAAATGYAVLLLLSGALVLALARPRLRTGPRGPSWASTAARRGFGLPSR